MAFLYRKKLRNELETNEIAWFDFLRKIQTAWFQLSIKDGYSKIARPAWTPWRVWTLVFESRDGGCWSIRTPDPCGSSRHGFGPRSWKWFPEWLQWVLEAEKDPKNKLADNLFSFKKRTRILIKQRVETVFNHKYSKLKRENLHLVNIIIIKLVIISFLSKLETNIG